MHLAARWLVGHIVAANMVPDAVASPELEVKLAKDGEPETPLTTEQRQELLMKVLEENGSLGKLDGWKKKRWPSKPSGSLLNSTTSSVWKGMRLVVLTSPNMSLSCSPSRTSPSKRDSEE